LDVSGELSYKVEVVELPRGTFVSFLLKGVGERFVVCENCKMTGLQHVAEMSYSFVNCQELPVVRAVLLLGRGQFSGEEAQGLPGIIDTLLEDSPQSGGGSIRDECEGGGCVGVGQESGAG
jgi:hypothetical protein